MESPSSTCENIGTTATATAQHQVVYYPSSMIHHGQPVPAPGMYLAPANGIVPVQGVPVSPQLQRVAHQGVALRHDGFYGYEPK